VSGAIGYGDSLILGVVEGLTEFLPVSSTGHLTVAESLLGLQTDNPAVTAFTVIIQFGAIVATFLYFRRDIVRLVAAWVRGLVSAPARENPDYRFAWYVIAGSIPVVIAGVLFKPLITGPLRSLWVIAAALVLWSAVMYVAEGRGRQKYEEEELTLRAALTIGLVQCLALVPGVSRSGATISAGLLLDYTRVTATRLSFFLGIPALTAAGLFELKDALHGGSVGAAALVVGTVVSFVVAYVSIAWLLRFVVRHSIATFVWYRVAVGVLLAVALAAGWLAAT
jgi:undecaprenyl-diphosphatase